MSRLEELLRRLPVGLDHGRASFTLDRVGDGGKVEAVVGGRVEDVDGVDSSLAGLFVPEDQIDPMV